MSQVESELANLRGILRTLEPTGQNGFEGLLAAVLTDVTRVNFRIAQSGSQHGKDGQSTDSGVKFEAKLYDKEVSKNDVLNKVAEIGVYDDGRTDLWILGSTGAVPTQVADIIDKLGQRLTIATLILDWPNAGLPTLAALLVMAGEATARFLAEKLGVDEHQIRGGLDVIKTHPHYADRAAELTALLFQPGISPTVAIRANDAWLRAAFENRSRARVIFGQPLSPADTSLVGILDRPALCERFKAQAFQTSNGTIAALLGADGNGKSWLFAQAWLSEPNKPLTVILLPNDFSAQVSLERLEDLIVSKLITQTNDTATGVTKERWRNLLARWKHLNKPDHPRIVVFVDGINQRQNLPWNNILDLLNGLVGDVGGALAISCRTFFFRDHLKGRLVSDVKEIEVPEWTQQELEQLLTEHGISISKLAPGVASSLRNPRVLAIALELLNTAQIEQIEELSVSRLLFEHIRSSDNGLSVPIRPYEFVRAIRDHATVIINRLRDTKVPDDLTVFDHRPDDQTSLTASLTEQFDAVAAGRFFEPLESDPSLYELREDGLPLALGLSLVSSAQRAYRNGHSLTEELSRILEPIASLDKTADILLSAIVAACLDERSNDAVTGALIQAFVGVQNPDNSRYPEFRALARHSPSPFLVALENSTVLKRESSTLSWLTDALYEIRKEPGIFDAFVPFLNRWLNMYSEAPERRVFSRKRDDAKKYADECEKKKTELETRLKSLSEGERAILAELRQEERGDYMRICRIAIQFLATMPLQTFARALRNWKFADALNGGIMSPTREFATLITFNTADWVETRAALLREVSPLREPGVSRTGKWALVGLLSATGAMDDAKEAVVIVEELRKDRERLFGSWRRIETYCASDPCDPSSERPNNIDGTAEQYASLDLNQVRNTMGMGQEDHFFEDARVGLARFRPDAAIAGIRRFADNVLSREDVPFRFGIFLLENHTLALDDEVAKKFVTKAAALVAQSLQAENKYGDAWVAGQYALLTAFPHMTGNEQLFALLGHTKDEDLLLNLTDTLRACDENKYEAALAKAYADNDETIQFRLLAFAQHTNIVLSEPSKEIVARLSDSSRKLVRLCAFGLICRLKDRRLVETIVASQWSAAALDRTKDWYEMWYGSHILVEASLQGLISDEECLQRIDLCAFLAFAKARGLAGTVAVAQRLDAAIGRACGYRTSLTLPDIEVKAGGQCRPSLFSINEKQVSNESPIDAFRRLAESENNWKERQWRAREAFLTFERELTKAGAYLIVETVCVELIEEIAKADKAILDRWYGLFISMDHDGLALVHNVATLVAQVVSRYDVVRSAELFLRLENVIPTVRTASGRARIELDAVAVWGAADGEAVNKLRFARLDRASNDKVLADETLAALNAGKETLLKEYILSRQQRPEPAYQARAIMVAGFSDGQEWAIETLKRYEGGHGFLSGAHDAAKFALDRYFWSQHWANLMASATVETDMWRYGVILGKIVDGRFQNPQPDYAPDSLMARYCHSLEDMIEARIKKWSDKRSKKLFGQDAPDQIYLS